MNASYRLLIFTACLMTVARPFTAFAADLLSNVQGVAIETQRDAQRSQERIDGLSDETRQLLEDYRATGRRIDTLRAYTEQMQRLIEDQEREQASLAGQLVEVDRTRQGLLPLMQRMLYTLERFVELDLPFLQEERRSRVQRLRAMMDRADVNNAEKFRRILEAYQIENDYGRTLEAYRATLQGDKGERTVEFLRLGRLALYYQSLDGAETGIWNRQTRAWDRLPDSARFSVRQGLRMARKELAPELLPLPVPAPEAGS